MPSILDGLPPPEQYLRRREVTALLGVSRSTLYAWMHERGFPKPDTISASSVRWRASDVRAWQDAQRPTS